MTEELTKRLEENFRLQEEVTSLLAQLVDVQQKVKRVGQSHYSSIVGDRVRWGGSTGE